MGASDAPGRLVFFFGAGASLVGEAGLPLFDEVRRAVFDGLNLHEICDLSSISSSKEEVDATVKALVGLLAPEALLLLLYRSGADVPRVLIDLFNQPQAKPNVVHDLAAIALREGAAVWTTNYDTLIEEAAARLGVAPEVSVTTVSEDPGDARLVKVHGSLLARASGSTDAGRGAAARWTGSTPLLYTAPPLVTGLPEQAKKRLFADLAGAHLVVLGYAGADIDLYPALREGVQLADRVTWFELDDDDRVAALQDRFDLRRSGHEAERAGDRFVWATANPSETFVEWAVRSLPGLDETTRGLIIGRPVDPEWPSLDAGTLSMSAEGRVRLAYQLGLGHCVRPEVTRQVSSLLRRRFRTRARGRSARGGRWTSVALAAAADLPAPGRVRDWLRRLATQERISDESCPSTSRILRWLDQRWEPHLALQASHALKHDGRTSQALSLAREALARAMGEPERIDVIGALSFQCSDLASIAGDFEGAREQARQGLGSVSSVVMALWERLVPLSSDAAQGRELSASRLASLREVRYLFEVLRRPDGHLWAGLAEGLAYKNARDWSRSVAVFETVRDRAEDTAHRLPGVAARANLQLADIARLTSDPARALTHLDQIDDHGLVGLWSRLERGLVLGATPQDLRADLALDFSDAGCPLGLTVLDQIGAVGPGRTAINWT